MSVSNDGQGATAMQPKDAIALLAQGKITVIDVRDASELTASGTATGGLHVPLALIALKADSAGPDYDARIKKGRPVAVFCALGGRAGKAVQALQALGYEAHNLGGFSDWQESGGPVSR